MEQGNVLWPNKLKMVAQDWETRSEDVEIIVFPKDLFVRPSGVMFIDEIVEMLFRKVAGSTQGGDGNDFAPTAD